MCAHACVRVCWCSGVRVCVFAYACVLVGLFGFAPGVCGYAGVRASGVWWVCAARVCASSPIRGARDPN